MSKILTEMARTLLVPSTHIESIARSASHRYKKYTIIKRSGRGERVIHHPARELKALQRWLLHNCLCHLPVHEAAFAYRKNIKDGPKYGIAPNARRHQNSSFLLRIDFDKFFPSISESDIKAYFELAEEAWFPECLRPWSADDTELLTKLVCCEGALTIGAPTSPALSNALCFELDRRLSSEAGSRGVAYSRYADDLFFSTSKKDVLTDFERSVVPGALAALTIPKSLNINQSKTRHLSRKMRRVVTGMVLSSSKNPPPPSLGHATKRQIRAMVHRVKKGTLSEETQATLAGLLAHCASVDPEIINKLIYTYGPDVVARARIHPNRDTDSG